jgi:hypothetical protein
MMFFAREKELMREYVRKTNKTSLAVTFIILIITIAVTEFFASFNIYLLQHVPQSEKILLGFFEISALLTITAALLSLIIVSGMTDEFNYYFRKRPLMIFASAATIGNFAAFFVIENTSYPYVVFFSSLTAINVLTIAFSIYSAENVLEEKHRQTRRK